ncbi:MAG: DUF975 family protein [Lachnospiraceae bacterium]|nr:DUF975 family protein [Lachnospiraceae bacterium]
MWSISNLKNRGKVAFKRNYWKSVLVCLLLSIIVGGAASSSASNANDEEQTKTDIQYVPGDRYEQGSGEFYFDEETGQFNYDMGNTFPGDIQDATGGNDSSGSLFSNVLDGGLLAMSMGMIFIIVVIAIIIAIIIDIFLYNPLKVGSKRFFFLNQKENAEVKEICYAYDHGWKNVGTILFFRDLYTFLWALLLIIPGIVKAYEYRMIPYILAENPDMRREEVFALSKKMMKGEKWHTFVMDLSFLGWHILGIITLGIVEIFWTLPYHSSTNATLYEALKYLKIDNQRNDYSDGFTQSNTDFSNENHDE